MKPKLQTKLPKSCWRAAEPMPARIEYAIGDIGDLDLGGNHFDILYGAAILEHVPDLNKVAQKTHQILASGGIASLHGIPLMVRTPASSYHSYGG
jgi:2-polyprenyl-3-methyl-5-hydroxy-6-metoxy-1,4-benzoquinol methylase